MIKFSKIKRIYQPRKIMQLSQKILTDSMLISSEDVLSQGIKIPRKNFLRYTVDLDFIFHGKDNVILTRKKVIEIFNNNIHHGILSSIVWGFPRGGLPGGRPLNNIFENLDFFKDTISEILENGLCEKSFEIINSKPGVKNGATTKMLYFSGAKIGDAKCLIFDSRVRDYMLKNKPSDLDSTTRALPQHSLYPGWHGYQLFCREVKNLSSKLNISVDAIEMYMFNAAPNRRKAQHKIIED
jgi:hypothetical protein